MVSSDQAPLDASSARPAVRQGRESLVSGAGSLVISAWRRGEVEVLTVAGEVDLGTGAQLWEELRRCLEGRPPVLVVDLTGVTFFGSTGLGVLVETRNAAAPHTTVRLVGNHIVQRTLQITGVDQVMGLFDSVQHALASA